MNSSLSHMLNPAAARPDPSIPPSGGPVRSALRTLTIDTLTQVGTLDVTDRHAVHATLNSIDRLLAVLDAQSPRLRELANGLRNAGGASRSTIAAALYRELATLTEPLLGLTAVSAFQFED